jgi:transcriptional regulator with XRE-family HTH domain
VTETLKELGKSIRDKRQKRRLTLEQLSSGTGLSKSFLSQMERGLTEPSISSLKKIAKFFGFSVVNFFPSEDVSHPDWDYRNSVPENNGPVSRYIEDIKTVRADRRKRLSLPGSGIVYDLLTPDMYRQLEVMYMKVNEGETSGDEPMTDPPGEKFALVLKGTLELKLGDETYILNEGDSIYYPTKIPHSWRATEGDSIEVLWILTPPSF